MIKTHKIRLNPTKEQESYFQRAVGIARFVFNWGLAEWKRWKIEHPAQEHGVMALKKDFNAIKAERYPWVYSVAKDVAEGAFTNLNTALNNYFSSKKGLRKGPKVGFPKFRAKKAQRQSFRLNNDKISIRGYYMHIPRLGWVNMAETLRFQGKIMGAVVIQEAGHWHAAITVEIEQLEHYEFTESLVGIDLGIKTLMVLSNGKQYENQALLRSNLTHLKRLNRRLTRRVIGSRRWFKAKEQLSNYHAKIANQRMDYLHKVTTNIARTYAVIGLENLNVSGMMKNHKLALSLSDASFGEIRRQLIYKSKWFSGQVVLIDRFFPSSRRCSACGYIKKTLTLKERIWVCPNCAKAHDRDLNAAINIAIEAQRILELSPVVATSGLKLVDGM